MSTIQNQGHQALASGLPSVCSAVAAALALEELDRLRAIECLPTPEKLLECLRARTNDFDLLAGIAGAYLHERGIGGGCHD
jgi:hypothetical protein